MSQAPIICASARSTHKGIMRKDLMKSIREEIAQEQSTKRLHYAIL